MRVTPKASHTRIEVGETVKVYVTPPPADGQANEAVLRLVADTLGVAKTRIRVVKGQHSRDKTLAVEGLTAEEIAARLAAI